MTILNSFSSQELQIALKSNMLIMRSLPELYCEWNQTMIIENSCCTLSKSIYIYRPSKYSLFHSKQILSYSICLGSFWLRLDQKWDQKAVWKSTQCSAKQRNLYLPKRGACNTKPWVTPSVAEPQVPFILPAPMQQGTVDMMHLIMFTVTA